MSEPVCCNCASECINAGGASAHWCIYHTPDYEVLEQRYQRLEQVVKELYKELERVAGKPLNRRTRDDLIFTYFGKLYDLGVSLDD